MKELILKLHEINAIKFGEYKMKSGILTPIYIDLRLTVSYPEVLQMVADAMWKKIQDVNFDLMCGVPYTALPFATIMSVKNNKPMVMRRKEVKEYGTKKAIEGYFKPGQTCLIVEDLITSGSSVFETIEPLEKEDLRVADIVVLVDREQGGKKHVEEKGYHLHTVFTLSQMLDTLKKENKLDSGMVTKVKTFIADNQT